MHDDILTFSDEAGSDLGHTIKVYALSTCGFCKRALQYLRDNKIGFRYIYLDTLEPDLKSKIKQDLVDKYKERLAFPFLVLDEDKSSQKVIVGFMQDDYEEIFHKSQK